MHPGTKILDIEEIQEMAMSDEYYGYCIYCGYEQYGCEPDARMYTCEDCGKNGVCGAAEILMVWPFLELLEQDSNRE